MKKQILTLISFFAAGALVFGQDTSSAFSDATDNGDGSFTNWIGTFTPDGGLSTTGFIDHAEHGSLYLVSSGQDVWLYDQNVDALGDDFHGWIYTNREVFPYFYILNNAESFWLAFLPGIEGPEATPRVFFNPADASTVLLSDRTVNDIVETAIAAGNFTSLATALTTADLVSTLQGEGPFTVFAPTDTAFGKLDSATLDDLLNNPDSLPALTDILLYHVVPGELSAADLGLDVDDLFSGEASTKYLTTVGGSDLRLDVTPFGVMINGESMVQTADLETSNGLIHVIDTVLLPPADIVDTAIGAGLSSLATALTEAELVETLRGDGPFTVFAPVNSAFEALGQETLDDLFMDENIATLQDILLFHVVSGARVYESEVAPGMVQMANGDMAEITADEDGNVFIEGAQIIQTDINTSNGVVHLIDTVITPPAE
ncbi:MAG: hypothetical protein GVY10_01145 [Verrucomicrobia bacterium]|jgi:transforming growth factor-beta-induced protein|nr:hypothetical protein [Verrucomicrobiota bacterium]